MPLVRPGELRVRAARIRWLVPGVCIDREAARRYSTYTCTGNWRQQTAVKAIPISTARTRLFELFDTVTEGRTTRVVISRRDREERAVLTSEAYLRHLERQIRELTHSVMTVTERPAKPYKFIGTIKASMPAEEIIRENRAVQKALTDAKMERIWKELESDD